MERRWDNMYSLNKFFMLKCNDRQVMLYHLLWYARDITFSVRRARTHTSYTNTFPRRLRRRHCGGVLPHVHNHDKCGRHVLGLELLWPAGHRDNLGLAHAGGRGRSVRAHLSRFIIIFLVNNEIMLYFKSSTVENRYVLCIGVGRGQPRFTRS